MAKKRRKSSSSSGLKIPNTNKLLKIAAFSLGAAVIGAQFLPNVDPRLRAAAGGFLAGGPIGGAIGYFAQPTLSGLLGGQAAATAPSGGVGAFV